MTEVAIVGLGPWGLSALERLLELAGRSGRRAGALTVHVVEPGTPGSGAYRTDEPDYFILNTPCGEHAMHPDPERTSREGFFAWAQSRGYRFVGDRCQVTTAGRPLHPDDFLPRRLMGEYLEWYYRELVSHLPDQVSVVHHKTTARDVVRSGRGERLELGDGGQLEVDYVVLATGHTPNDGEALAGALEPYPVESYAGAAEARAPVVVSGMGLVALDVMIAFTRGRGGRFVGEDRLRYVPSGREPRLYLFSRTGEPYLAKAVGAADPTGSYRPRICTPEAIERLRAARLAATGSERIDARTDLMPLVFAEMELRYYEQSARLHEGEASASFLAAELEAAWRQGGLEAAVSPYANKYGTFDARGRFFDSSLGRAASASDYEARVHDLVADDLDEALVAGGASPTKAAFEVLRVLRDTMRDAVEFRRLTYESYLDFQNVIRGRVTRLITGPPAFRSQQLLALMDAGIVRAPFGPSPCVKRRRHGRVVVTSRHLERPFFLEGGLLVRGHLDDPTCHRSASRLYQNLYAKGRISQYRYDDEPVGSIELTDRLQPVSAAGEPQERLFVLGAPTEGIRYFTAYIPSPKSRVRAFVDAERCAATILGEAG